MASIALPSNIAVIFCIQDIVEHLPVAWFTFQIFIRDVLDASSPGSPAILTEDLHGFSQFLQGNVRIFSLLGHNPVFPNSFQFIPAFSAFIPWIIF
jgi:hypothetical protein